MTAKMELIINEDTMCYISQAEIGGDLGIYDARVDFTALSATEQCPRWGGIRYGLGVTHGQTGRAMALEAGSAAHDFFAAVRLLELCHNVKADGALPERINAFFVHHGERLFTYERMKHAKEEVGEDDPSAIISDELLSLNFCINILYSSNFYDDPSDNRRTMANIEEACIAYYRNWPFTRWPLYVEDYSKPDCLVGVELPVDLDVEFVTNGIQDLRLNYIGRMDGLHMHSYMQQGKRKEGAVVHENKTGARIDSAWEAGQRMSPQAIGYAVQSSLYTSQPIERAFVHGMQIPQPRAAYGQGVHQFPIDISHDRYVNWAVWTYKWAKMFNAARENPAYSQQHFHSCNRYFRPCSFLDICMEDDPEDRTAMIEGLEYQPWDPLVEDKVS